MKKTQLILTLAILSAGGLSHAAPGAALLEDQYKRALNAVVQDVRGKADPAEKREAIGGYLERMQTGLRKAESLASLSESDRVILQSMDGKLAAYRAELQGEAGYAPVADADLDGFAGYMQQGMEQAPIGGGVYLSGGALIIILLILILIL